MRDDPPNPFFPALLVGVGLVLVGVALGLLYIDYVARGGIFLDKIENPEIELAGAWNNMTLILIALPVGSVGAGLTGAGTIVTLYAFLRGRSVTAR